MPLNIIIGKTKTGKSKKIYDMIDSLTKNNKEVMLFVPSQLRMQAEENYMDFQKKDGIIGFEITTINSFVEDILKSISLGFNDKYINDFEKKLIVSKILSKETNLLNMYSKVKKKTGFLDTISIYMDLFRKEKIDESVLNKENIKNDGVYFKLKELIDFSKVYNEHIDNNFKDNISNIDYVCEKIKEGTVEKLPQNSVHMFFDGYNNFSLAEKKYISTLLSKGYDVNISVTSDISESEIKNIEEISFEEDMFYVSKLTLKEIITTAKNLNQKVQYMFLKGMKNSSVSDIEYLTENIFRNSNSDIDKKIAENVQILLLQNEYKEIRYIAEDISKKIREDDLLKFNDFTIYASNINSISFVVNQVFNEYNIPVYINMNNELHSNMLIKYISYLLDDTMYKININKLMDCAKLNLNDFKESDICYFENYLLEYNIKPYNFNKEFKINSTNQKDMYDLVRINKIREEIYNTYFSVYESLNKKEGLNIKEYAGALFNHLKEKFVLKKFNEEITRLEETDKLEEKYIASIYRQVYDSLCNIFDSIYKIYTDEKIKFKEFRELFEFAKNNIELKSVPNSLDEVKLLDINTSRVNSSKYVYIISLNEGKLPTEVSEDSVFSDRELEELKLSEIEFKNTTISKINMQYFNIYDAISSATQKLVFTLSSADISGKSLRPSTVINNIKQVLGITVIGNVTQDDKLDAKKIYSTAAILEYLCSKILEVESKIASSKNGNDLENVKIEMLEILDIYEYLKTSTKVLDIINYVKNDSNLKESTIKRIYKDELYTSISKLEQFKKCPFSYYIKYGLKLNKRKVFEISSLDIGSFMHNVLDRFSKKIYSEGISWNSLYTQKYDYIKILKKQVEEELGTVFSKHKESIKFLMLKKKLENNMIKVVENIILSFKQSNFKEYGSEIEFSEKGMFAPIEICLSTGSKMKVVGKIDRIDTAVIDGITYARIIDYKSSKRDLSLDDIKEGISLQLATYLDAFIQNKEKEKENVMPAAMLYFNLTDKLTTFSDYETYNKSYKKEIIKELRMKGIFLKDIKVISAMDENLETDERLIDISKKTLASEKSSKKALLQEDFLKLVNNMNNVLKDIGKEIMDGRVKIDPLIKKDVCKYCDFSSVCRKDICI